MSSKFLGLHKKLWWLIFIIFYSTIIALMIASISTSSWVYTNMKVNIKNFENSDSSINHFKGKDFSGSLFYCTKSCDASYSKLSKEWCDYKEKVLYENFYYEDSRYFEMNEFYVYSVMSLCTTFRTLEKSMRIYVASEVFAIICLIGCIIVLGLFFMKIKNYLLIFLFSLLSCVAHLEGFITFMVLTKTNFNGWCDDFPYFYDLPLDLCASYGPNIALSISILLPLMSIYFCLFRDFKYIKKSLNHS